MCLTDVGEVLGVAVEVPVPVVVTAEAERRRRAVPLVDDAELVRTLGQVVGDDHVLIRLWEVKKHKQENIIICAFIDSSYYDYYTTIT